MYIDRKNRYIAVPWSGAGGNIAILSLNKPIRVPDTPGLIECGSNQLDMDFHPFNDDIIVTGLENAKIKIWQIPENLISQKQNFRTESASLSGHYSKVTLTQFNPVASNVLASASYDFTIKSYFASFFSSLFFFLIVFFSNTDSGILKKHLLFKQSLIQMI